MTQRVRGWYDVQSDLVSEQERTADPLILDELLVPAGKIDDEVRAEIVPLLEAAPGRQRAKVVERRRRDQVNRLVEERARRQFSNSKTSSGWSSHS